MARTYCDDHASLSAAVVCRNGLHDIVSGCITELETGLPLPEASQEAVTAANAVINQSGSEECLRGKLSNAILRLSNSCDVSGHSSTACELASEIAGQESELSMVDMIYTFQSLLDLLGDLDTSH